MSERKLATIEHISEINPIEGADQIECVTIRGWRVVVKKNEFSTGDLCVYCEIDSVMPQRPEFEFLSSVKYRIKTQKMRGQISQGICFPISILPKETFTVGQVLEVGMDVTELLGVTKHEPPIPAELSGVVKGNFPSHSIKTDEERIQNLKEYYEEYRKNRWVVSEKIDGTSFSAFIYNNEFGVASRNLELKETETNTFWRVARELKVEYKMRLFMAKTDLKSLTLQGELYGESIQKNRYKIKGQTVRFFRIFDPEKYSFFSYEEFISAMDEMGLTSVPIIDDDMRLPETLDELLLFADGKSFIADTQREGIVFVAREAIHPDTRPLEKFQNRLSFKVISNKFLLKE